MIWLLLALATLSTLMVLSSAYLAYHVLLARRARTALACMQYNSTLTDSPNILVQVPVKDEDPELVERLCRSLQGCSCSVVIVSDSDFNRTMEYAERAFSFLGWRARVLWRKQSKGRKAGALNESLRSAKGFDVYVVLDADAVPAPGAVEELAAAAMKYGGAVAPWKPLNAKASPVAEAVSAALLFTDKTLYLGRSASGFLLFLKGSGCAVSSKTLRDAGLWCETAITEDLELSVRLYERGYKVVLVPREVYVEVPETYAALKKQQARWAYGAMQVIRRRASTILLRIKEPITKRIEALAYLAQYSAIALTPLFAAILAVSSIALRVDMALYTAPAAAIFTAVAALYSYEFIKAQLENGASLKESIVCLGRLTAMTTSMSPTILVEAMKAILGVKREWTITPKGRKAKQERGIGLMEISFAFLLIVSAAACLALNLMLSAATLAVIALPVVYTIIRAGSGYW